MQCLHLFVIVLFVAKSASRLSAIKIWLMIARLRVEYPYELCIATFLERTLIASACDRNALGRQLWLLQVGLKASCLMHNRKNFLMTIE